MVWKIGVLRRIFFALPFLAAAIAGFASLASLQYQETFHLDVVQRAYLVAPVQVFVLIGLVIGADLGARLAARGMHLVFRMLAMAAVVASGFAVLFALAPSVPVAFFADAGIEASLAIVSPGRAGRTVPGHTPAGPLRRLFDRRPLRRCPVWWSSRSSVPSATRWDSATGCSSWCPSS